MSAVEHDGFVEHKVRRGETLESIASAHGMTWRQLAQFSFGTDHPSAVTDALRAYVGCTRRTADGRSYVFDDTDDPGILYLPKAIPEVQVSTRQPTELRVTRPPFTATVELQTVDETGLPVPEVSLVLERADAAGGAPPQNRIEVKTDDKGCGRAAKVPAGTYRIRLADGEPALFWRGRAPGPTGGSSDEELATLEPAFVSTLQRDPLTTVVVRRDLSPEARRSLCRIRDAYAFDRRRGASVPRGAAIDDVTAGMSVRSRHACCDTLFLAAGWTDRRLSEIALDRLLSELLPEWLDDRCPLARMRGYHVILLDPGLGKIQLRTSEGVAKGTFDLHRAVELAAPFGAYAPFSAVKEQDGSAEPWQLFADIATRTYLIADQHAPTSRFELRDVVDPEKRADFDAVVAGFAKSPVPIVLPVPSARALLAFALAGGSGTLENYGSEAAINDRIHQRNLLVCGNAAAAYRSFLDAYVGAVRGCRSTSELRSLGPPAPPYEFPTPARATSEQLTELLEEYDVSQLDAWKEIAIRLDQLAGKKSEGFPFLRFKVKYEADASKAGELEGLTPEVAELAKYAPVAIEIEGNLELQLRDGVEVIKQGTSWKAEVKAKVKEKLDEASKAVVQTAGGNAILVTANGSPRAIFDGALGRTRIQGDLSSEGAKLDLERGGTKANLELAKDKVKVGVDVDGKGGGVELSKEKAAVKLGAYEFELKATGESKMSVDLGGAVVDTRWEPRSAEMTAGVTLPLGKLAKKLQAMGGAGEKHGKALEELKWLEVGAEVGFVGSREETTLAVFARTRGFFQRRELNELFKPETQWSSLSLDEVTSLANLGWTRETWDQKYDPEARRLPASCDKAREALTAVERIAIVDLGFHAYEEYGAMVHDRTKAGRSAK